LNDQLAAQPREETCGLAPSPTGWQLLRHRSRGRGALPTTSPPAPVRRAAAAGRCTPRCSRGTLKAGRRRPKPCGVCSALQHVRLHGRARGSEQPERIGALAPHLDAGTSVRTFIPLAP